MGRYIADLVQALLTNGFDWSSEEWSKASGRATVGLDQIRTRLSMSITTFVGYIDAMHKATQRYRRLVISITTMIDWSHPITEVRVRDKAQGRPETSAHGVSKMASAQTR